MRKILLVTLSIFTLSIVYSQNDYIGYYHLVRKANKLYFDEKYDSAYTIYQDAFSKVDFVPRRELYLAAKSAKKLKHKAEAHQLKNEIKLNRKQINVHYKKTIDSLAKEDQRVRGKKYYEAALLCNSAKKDSSIDRKSPDYLSAQLLMKEWIKVDSNNIEMLKYLIQLYGFPSEKRVGEWAGLNAFLILLHYDADTDNTIMKPILDSALINGDISPENYAWIADRRLLWDQGKPAYYYQMTTGLDKLSKEEIEEINKRRYLIGLGGVYEGRTITKKGNKTIVTYDH